LTQFAQVQWGIPPFSTKKKWENIDEPIEQCSKDGKTWPNRRSPMPEPGQTTISDPVVNRIIEHYRIQVGDKTCARTAGRIIQAFHTAGLSLQPEPSSDPHTIGRHLDVSA
jgi:hypothetical protein